MHGRSQECRISSGVGERYPHADTSLAANGLEPVGQQTGLMV